MQLLDTVRAVLDETVGTRGAVRNCHTELHRRDEAEQAVRRLSERIPAAATPDEDRRASA